MADGSAVAVLLSIVAVIIFRFVIKKWLMNDANSKARVHIKQLFIYPIKSCGGVAVESWPLGRRGFMDDRRWMIVDEDGVFVSQREQSRMVLIKPSYSPDQKYLYLDAPKMEQLKIHRTKKNTGKVVNVDLWDNKMVAMEEAEECHQWVSKFLRGKYRVVRVSDDKTFREIPDDYTRGNQADGQPGFSDCLPFLMLSQKSLDGLGERGAPNDVRRFRPNILVEGALSAHEEDLWGCLQINGVVFHGLRQCTRCRLTTVDPDTGMVFKQEPLDTLRRYRAPLTSDGRRDMVPVFGLQMSHNWESSMGVRISVGDSVRVSELREALPLAPVKESRQTDKKNK